MFLLFDGLASVADDGKGTAGDFLDGLTSETSRTREEDDA